MSIATRNLQHDKLRLALNVACVALALLAATAAISGATWLRRRV